MPRNANSLRILNISAQRPDSTGSGVYLTELVRGQEALGHEAAILCGLGAGHEAEPPSDRTRLFAVRFDSDELPFHVCGMSDTMPYPSTRYRDMTPAMLAQFEQAFGRTIDNAIEAFCPDVIVCHHLYLVTTLVVEHAHGRCPVVAICHSTDLRQLGKHALCVGAGKEGEALELRIRKGIRSLDAVLALHDEQARAICQAFDLAPERISVIGTGYDARLFSRNDAVLREPGSLVYVGKISRAKGVESLMRSLALLGPSEGPSLVRLVGGRGVDDEEYNAIAALASSAPQPVEFAGRVEDGELVESYRRAQVFVLPSFYEGLPLVAIEALACGCRVVMTDLPGVRPWVEANLPAAPIEWVAPPRMDSVDVPLAEDLPAFERRLANALATALSKGFASPLDATALSWDSVAKRLLGFACDYVSG